MSTKITTEKLQHLYETLRPYVRLLFVILFLWLTNPYVVRLMDKINAFCIKDMEPAFGCIVITASALYTVKLVCKAWRDTYYISTLYLACWLAGVGYYSYFRFLSDNYTFWGFDVCGWHAAYLDALALPTIALVILYIDCHRKRKKHTTDCYTFVDEPIADEGDDCFGYKDIASYLKEDLEHTDVSEHAFSVGITGAWGMGKSSFLNLFEKAVKEDEKSSDIVIRFYPRSSSSVSDIQADFFQTFSRTIGRYHTKVHRLVWMYKLALRLADYDGIVGELLTFVCKANAESEKKSICEALRKLGRRIYVIIEDLDRLTGKELIEVFKLIDRNGDFSNVIYMSAYDKEYVNGVLKQEFGHQVAVCFTDKYFNYELSLPTQKTWVVKDYINRYLQNKVLATTEDPEVKKSLTDHWHSVGEILARSLGTIRHAKRFINLFISRYDHVKDDVNVCDFLLLTLVRYSNLAIYDAIVKCQLVKQGGILQGSKNTMYLVEDFENKIKEYNVENDIVSILKLLFPSKGEDEYGESKYKRIRRAASFDIYFYDRYRNRIYHEDIAPIFEEQDDDKALSVLESLMGDTAKRKTIEEYLIFRGIDWIDSPDKLQRYIKLIVLAYHETNGKLNYGDSLGSMLYKTTAADFVRNKAIKDLSEYSATLYRSLDEMIQRCSLSIGLKLTNILGDIKRAGENASDYALSSDQFVELAYKALQYYTEHTDPTSWNPMKSIELSLIYPVGEKTIDNKAKEYIMGQLNSAPESYAAGMIHSSVSDAKNGNKLYLSFREAGLLQQLFSNWDEEFPRWIEKLPSGDEQYVFRALSDALKRNDEIVVNALKDKYEPNDYAGFREAIEKDEEAKFDR